MRNLSLYAALASAIFAFAGASSPPSTAEGQKDAKTTPV